MLFPGDAYKAKLVDLCTGNVIYVKENYVWIKYMRILLYLYNCKVLVLWYFKIRLFLLKIIWRINYFKRCKGQFKAFDYISK